MSRWQPIASMVTTAPSIAEQVKQLGDGDDPVRLVRHLDLAEHQALMRRKGRDHMDRRLGVRLPAAPGIDDTEDHAADALTP